MSEDAREMYRSPKVHDLTRKSPDCDSEVEQQRRELSLPEPPSGPDIEWVRSLLAPFKNRHAQRKDVG